MTRREFEQAFADELAYERDQEALYHLENRLAEDKGRLMMAADTIPGFKLGLGGVVNVFLDAEK